MSRVGQGVPCQAEEEQTYLVDFEGCCRLRAQLMSGGCRGWGQGIHRLSAKGFNSSHSQGGSHGGDARPEGTGHRDTGKDSSLWGHDACWGRGQTPRCPGGRRLSGSWGAGLIYPLLTTSPTFALLVCVPYPSPKKAALTSGKGMRGPGVQVGNLKCTGETCSSPQAPRLFCCLLSCFSQDGR